MLSPQCFIDAATLIGNNCRDNVITQARQDENDQIQQTLAIYLFGLQVVAEMFSTIFNSYIRFLRSKRVVFTCQSQEGLCMLDMVDE